MSMPRLPAFQSLVTPGVKTALAGLLVLAAGTPAASASEMAYTFTVAGCQGTRPVCTVVDFGASHYDLPLSDKLTFTYLADTSNIVSWSVGINYGFELLGGTASVVLTDGSGTVIQRGTFAASNDFFVSIDNIGAGVGLGTQGVLPTNPTFPGQVTYPIGIFGGVGLLTYDLSTAFGPITSPAVACPGFTGNLSQPCGLAFGIPLADGRIFDISTVFAATGTFSAAAAHATVPEPAALGLLGLGLAALGIARPTRKKGADTRLPWTLAEVLGGVAYFAIWLALWELRTWQVLERLAPCVSAEST